MDKARDAEFAVKDRFYRRSVSQLSPQGQAILADHFNEYLLKKTSIKSREHTTIATDIPEYLIEFASRSNERIQMRLARMGIKS